MPIINEKLNHQNWNVLLMSIQNSLIIFGYFLKIDIQMPSTTRQMQLLKLSLNDKTLSEYDIRLKSFSVKQKNTPEQNQLIERNSTPETFHPALKHIGSKNITPEEYKKFAQLLYHGVQYCLKNLKGPTEQYLIKKAVTLPQSSFQISGRLNSTRKKFLMLDLDETLIHSVFDQNLSCDVKMTVDGNQFRFNIRPYCFQFLKNMSQHYQIYVFTASTKDYAQPIVRYLNKKNKTIQGVLHRRNCLQTMNGFRIKDLRIIRNRTLEHIILVDNLVHSFGLQLENGIPILEFISNKQDRELLHLQKLLHQAKDCSDVRQFIKEKVRIKECLKYKQTDYFHINEDKWISNSRKEKYQQNQIQVKSNKKSSNIRSFLMCSS